MILRQATILYKGYDPSTLTKGSHKKVCVSCDQCGRVRWLNYHNYRDLCKSCARKGKGNSNYGKHWDDEHRQHQSNIMKDRHPTKKTKNKMSKNHADVSGDKNPMFGRRSKDHPAWKGGIANIRDHVLPEYKCRKMNERFNNSEFHHLSKSYGVYIPSALHRHISHSLLNNKNMSEINELAIQYLNRGL